QRRYRSGAGDRQACIAAPSGPAGSAEPDRCWQHVRVPLPRRAVAPAGCRHCPPCPRGPAMNTPERPARERPAPATLPPVQVELEQMIPEHAPLDLGLYSGSSDNGPLADPSLYFNRELSQLAFNFRVLAQALDPQVPLLERLKYLCISCTNLDEFFEIRAGSLHHAQDLGVSAAPDGLSPATVLARIHEQAATLVEAQYECWNQVLRPAMADAGVRVLARGSWSSRQTRWLRAYFRDEVMPVLSP